VQQADAHPSSRRCAERAMNDCDKQIRIRPQILPAKDVISIEEAASIIMKRGHAKTLRQAIKMIKAKIRNGELTTYQPWPRSQH
jgi:hypothetical protein